MPRDLTEWWATKRRCPPSSAHVESGGVSGFILARKSRLSFVLRLRSGQALSGLTATLHFENPLCCGRDSISSTAMAFGGLSDRKGIRAGVNLLDCV